MKARKKILYLIDDICINKAVYAIDFPCNVPCWAAEDRKWKLLLLQKCTFVI